MPRKLWFDNLSAAVAMIKGHEERQLTAMFHRFKLHYRFEAVFCNPGAGHEKGNVENKVGTTRRNWFVPVPVMTSWEQLNELMNQKAEKALEQDHYKHKQPIRSLWEEERGNLLELPQKSFDVVHLETAKLDKYGKVSIDRERFSVPGGAAQQHVSLHVYWDRVEVIDEAYETLSVIPRPSSLKQRDIDWIQELEQVAYKPRAIPYTMVYAALPETLQRYLDTTELPLRKKRIQSLLRWLKDGYDIDQTAEAVGHINPDLWDEEGVMYQALYRTIHPDPTEYLEETYTPFQVRDYEPVLEAYDTLTGKEWT